MNLNNEFDFIYYIFSFIFGTVFGSFFNVCIYRIPNNESVSKGRSHCPFCLTTLKSNDLIPLLSWIFLLGKCRYCGKKISSRYFTIELITGLIFLLGINKYFTSSYTLFDSFIFIYFTSCLLIVSFIDIDHLIIPDEISIGFLLIVGLLLSLIPHFPLNSSVFYKSLASTRWYQLLNSFLGFLAGGGILFLIAIIADYFYSKKNIEAMGFGDVKLAAGIGVFLGWKLSLLMLLLSFFFGSIISGVLILTGTKKRTDQIPFGPFIALAGIVSFLYGTYIINWYLNFSIILI